MFTGIVQGVATITSVKRVSDLMTIEACFPVGALAGAQVGASISLQGCCLTVVSVSGTAATFDLMGETLSRTSFSQLKEGAVLNFERSLRFGDEIGGHILSGHVDCTGEIIAIEASPNSRVVSFSVEPSWTRYLFEKGYVAINGASLTLTRVERDRGEFQVSLIPETLSKTTFGGAQVGDKVDIEIDRSTQAIVDTVERVLPAFLKRSEQKNP